MGQNNMVNLRTVALVGHGAAARPGVGDDDSPGQGRETRRLRLHRGTAQAMRQQARNTPSAA